MIQIINIGEKGLAVTFSKDDLTKIKDGKSLPGELVGPEGKVPILFMRDRTFKQMQKRFEQATEVAKGRIQAANQMGEGASLGTDLGLDSAENSQ